MYHYDYFARIKTFYDVWTMRYANSRHAFICIITRERNETRVPVEWENETKKRDIVSKKGLNKTNTKKKRIIKEYHMFSLKKLKKWNITNYFDCRKKKTDIFFNNSNNFRVTDLFFSHPYTRFFFILNNYYHHYHFSIIRTNLAKMLEN